MVFAHARVRSFYLSAARFPSSVFDVKISSPSTIFVVVEATSSKRGREGGGWVEKEKSGSFSVSFVRAAKFIFGRSLREGELNAYGRLGG